MVSLVKPSLITRIHAREILDSRGNPTIEVELSTAAGPVRSMVPSGASTGAHEAHELRDKNPARYGGKGVLKAVQNVNKVLAPQMVGQDAAKQQQLDALLCSIDGTPNKSRLGANAILGISLAACCAAALARRTPLYAHIRDCCRMLSKRRGARGARGADAFSMPVPFFNVINGGAHAGNRLAFQEYMIAPVGAKTFAEAVRMGAETYHVLKRLLREQYGRDAVNVGDEGGFAPPLREVEEPLRLLQRAIAGAGYAGRVMLALDCAASEFYRKKDGKMNGKMNSKMNSKMDGKKVYVVDGKGLTAGAMLRLYERLVSKYPIISIEDPYDQDDVAAFAALTKRIGRKIQIVGDDMLVTNMARMRLAKRSRACNALLLKVNQIGTVTESMEAALLARDYGWNLMVSHRSGETDDTFIADLAVGIASRQIKSGAPCRGERVSKYNRLLRIGEELGSKALYRPDVG